MDPLDTPAGRLCDQAYASTVKILTEQFARAGTHFPDWPDRRTYVVKCIELELTEEQVRCLDPEWSRGDPQGCSVAMESAKRGADELSKWFTDEVKKGLAP
ncbi:MAG: hypothetical protein KTR31_39795 [Myxococcales bacterium]|nr:hypothetical protein [Myxococcales bacterium]